MKRLIQHQRSPQSPKGLVVMGCCKGEVRDGVRRAAVLVLRVLESLRSQEGRMTKLGCVGVRKLISCSVGP